MKISNGEDMFFIFPFVFVVLLSLCFFVNEHKVSRLYVLKARALPDAVLGAVQRCKFRAHSKAGGR